MHCNMNSGFRKEWEFQRLVPKLSADSCDIVALNLNEMYLIATMNYMV